MNCLIEYYNEIQNGNILVGEELKKQIDKLITDLDNPRYNFDEKPGNLRIDFIQTFCKHTKSPFNGQPFILELWEKAIIQTAYGFKNADTGLRRFNEVILLIARNNSVIESFFGTLKCETIYLQKVKSLADLIRTIDEYIYWYNQERIKLTLGGYSPIQYRLMNQ